MLGALCLQLHYLPLVLLPLLVVEDLVMAYCVVLLVRTGIALIIIGYLACFQLRAYFNLLHRLMARQMRQAKLGATFAATFGIFQAEYNRSLWLLMRIDHEMYKYVAMIMVVVHTPTLIIHTNLIYFEPNMNIAIKCYMLLVMTIQVSLVVGSMLVIIHTSEAAYTMTNMLPRLQLRLAEQPTNLKLKVMKQFEAMNCPAPRRVTISVGSIDRIRRFSLVQLSFALMNYFLMIARLLIEERQNWIFE